MTLDRALANARVVGSLAQIAGVSAAEARTGLEALLPGISFALARNSATPAALTELLGVLGSESHERYLDSPDRLGSARAHRDGARVLESIVGSEAANESFLTSTAHECGLTASTLRVLLPRVALIASGALSRISENEEFDACVSLLDAAFGAANLGGGAPRGAPRKEKRWDS